MQSRFYINLRVYEYVVILEKVRVARRVVQSTECFRLCQLLPQLLCKHHMLTIDSTSSHIFRSSFEWAFLQFTP